MAGKGESIFKFVLTIPLLSEFGMSSDLEYPQGLSVIFG